MHIDVKMNMNMNMNMYVIRDIFMCVYMLIQEHAHWQYKGFCRDIGTFGLNLKFLFLYISYLH